MKMVRAFAEAILSDRLLLIVYRSMHRRVTERIVRPIEIEERNQEYFLRAYCYRSEDERVFRIRQIQRWEWVSPEGVTLAPGSEEPPRDPS